MLERMLRNAITSYIEWLNGEGKTPDYEMVEIVMILNSFLVWVERQGKQ